jgi:hypothetical protein
VGIIPNLDARVRTALDDLQKFAASRDPRDIARARTALRHLYGGPVRVHAEVRDGKRVPVAVANMPGYALLQAAMPEYRATDNVGSGGTLR